MNNNITEDYCSFEVSKLLKEKGFTWNDYRLFVVDGVPKHEVVKGLPRSLDNAFPCYNDSGKEIRPNKYTETNKHYPRPTHALALKWIRHNLKIHVQIESMIFGERDMKDTYCFTTTNLESAAFEEPIDEYNSPEEATEAALLYILTKPTHH